MAQTEPKNVQNDIPNRDGAFSVRIYNTANADLIYELSVYWHYKEGRSDHRIQDDRVRNVPRYAFCFVSLVNW